MGKIQNFFSGLFSENKLHRYEVYQIGDPRAFDFGGHSSTINHAYNRNSDVYSIIKRLSTNASKIPRQLWKEARNGEWEQVHEGDLWEIVTKQPNPTQNIYDYVEESITNLLLRGEVFRKGRKLVGFGDTFQELYVLNNAMIKVDSEIIGYRAQPTKYCITIDGKDIPIELDEINHVLYYNPSSLAMKQYRGLSPLEAGILPLISSTENKTAQSVMVKNGAPRGILSSRGNRGMTENQGKQLQEANDQRMLGSEKFGKPIITSADVDFVKMGLDPTQLKILESSVMSKRDLCDLYGVDSSLFNDPANKTYNNRKEAEKAMWTNAVIPANEKDIRGQSEWLLPAYNKRDKTTYQVRQDLSLLPVLHEDEARKAVGQERVSKIIISTLVADLSRTQKINTLMHTLNLSEDDATNLVGNA